MKYFSLLAWLEWEKAVISLVIVTREHSTLLNKMYLWNIWSNKKRITRYLWCLLKELLCRLNEATDKKTLDWDQQSLALYCCYFYLAPECFGYSFCMSQTSTTPHSFTRVSWLDQSHWTIWQSSGVINEAPSSRLKFCRLSGACSPLCICERTCKLSESSKRSVIAILVHWDYAEIHRRLIDAIDRWYR